VLEIKVSIYYTTIHYGEKSFKQEITVIDFSFNDLTGVSSIFIVEAISYYAGRLGYSIINTFASTSTAIINTATVKILLSMDSNTRSFSNIQFNVLFGGVVHP